MRIATLASAALLSGAAAAPLFGQHAHAAPVKTPAPQAAGLLPGMGTHTHRIATSSPEAQKFFDQGLTLLYGFNHDEAIRSFRRAAELDPKAPMPHWGIGLALGMNYNDPQPAEDRLRQAYEESQKALALSAGGSEAEAAYVAALSKRCASDPKADQRPLLHDYHAAMQELSRKYPDDLDAATLYAESGMNLNPWKLWKSDGTPNEGTLEIIAVLESVLKRDPTHPGANHYYIHAIEASPNPERALPSAARLETLVPMAGHLVHMPAHIQVRTGDYYGAERSNAKAAAVDRASMPVMGPNPMYRIMYYGHNLHFQSWAASMAGRSAEAKSAADRLYAVALPSASMDPMVEGYLVQPLVVAVRFRKWDEIRKMRDPGALVTVRAYWLYARGAAAAAAGKLAEATKEREAFRDAVAAMPADRPFGPQNSVQATIAVAGFDLDARIARARKDRKEAISSWRRAVAAEDALAYDEPMSWQNPMRESLGAALLADGQAAEAEKVFRDDLDRNPRNPRSLLGLAESLKAQGKTADAAWVQAQFATAWKRADTKITVGDL